ncbi:MAG TPA: universal stress protein [Acidimicrobiales bacterium]|jgi:nucleotide-binding universal stress UspA family protein|nr:universal stress protein [Acidimicrobiales bacterium]
MKAKIVVGVDGSKASRRALEWAVAEARLRDASLHVVYAWHYPYFAAMPTGGPLVSAQSLEEAGEQVIQDSLHDLDTAGIEIVTRPIGGPAAFVLIDLSEHADMVVVGSRGHGGFAGLVLGSVSQQVVSHARCPVVVVRDADD